MVLQQSTRICDGTASARVSTRVYLVSEPEQRNEDEVCTWVFYGAVGTLTRPLPSPTIAVTYQNLMSIEINSVTCRTTSPFCARPWIEVTLTTDDATRDKLKLLLYRQAQACTWKTGCTVILIPRRLSAKVTHVKFRSAPMCDFQVAEIWAACMSLAPACCGA